MRGEKTQALEQKVFKLQEELTENLRNRGAVRLHVYIVLSVTV